MTLPTENKYITLDLIEEVEKHPCIYELRKGIPRRSETMKAWDAISEELDLDEKWLKVKWNNIRSVFRKVHSLVLANKEVKKPYYYDKMLFIIPHIFRNSANQYSSHTVVSTFAKTSTNLKKKRKRNNHPPCPKSKKQYSETETQSSLIRIFDKNTYPDSSKSTFKTEYKSELKSEPKSELKSEPKSENETTKCILFNEHDCGDQITWCDVYEMEARKKFLLSLSEDMKHMTRSEERYFKKKFSQIVNKILKESEHQRS